MSAASRIVPKPAVLQEALRKTTEALAAELSCPTPAAPDWTSLEWTVARAVAAMHGVSPVLSSVLRWQGPAAWMRFLSEQRAHTANRHARIVELLERIDARMRADGVAAVALKGAALHAFGLYAAGERPMADVDLLVRPADAQRAARLIEALGFFESRSEVREREFSPLDHKNPGELGEHSANNIKIELHERIGETLPLCDTDITGHVFPARAQPGLNAYPSSASLLIHLLLHAAGGMAFQTLRLMHLHDIAILALRMTDADWDEVLARRTSQRGHWWAFPPLQMTARYFPSHIPSRMLCALSRDCPALLGKVYRNRRLSDVSYSYLWVDAFPGIEWSQSIAEMLRYAASRIRPSDETLEHRRRSAIADAWASQGDWPRLSQTRRILRWVVSRPIRTRTMHAVSVALSQPPQ